MNSQQFSFLFVLLVAAMCSAHIGGKAPDQDLTQYYCGRTLAKALALLCFDDIPNSNKRSDAGMYNAVLSLPYYKEQDMHMGWPWMVPNKARGMAGQRGKRQLVVSECCDKPCSINELLTYC
ncbi:Insulin-like polypeptide D [Operophtera brumata]|uniref:Insulin-like polypeptide D n=1 Tax=Operophtera brumata TaxID=104452 RepID=A0A0L7L7G8_OPEBR|nr:Insulin-like polypeptide D [Operophtera brumata]